MADNKPTKIPILKIILALSIGYFLYIEWRKDDWQARHKASVKEYLSPEGIAKRRAQKELEDRKKEEKLANDPVYQESLAKMADIDSAISGLIGLNVLTKVVMEGGYPTAYSLPSFSNATLEQKDIILRCVLMWGIIRNPNADFVWVFDGRTGKKVGNWSE
ncbi:MAG TPA: hypothetical protein DCS88_07925, partial [Alphaproteobacteria bacterium]|nr:hypothetical protein [Alphaproteobacteria bacterium]